MLNGTHSPSRIISALPLNLVFCSLLKGNLRKGVNRELQECFVEGHLHIFRLHSSFSLFVSTLFFLRVLERKTHSVSVSLIKPLFSMECPPLSVTSVSPPLCPILSFPLSALWFITQRRETGMWIYKPTLHSYQWIKAIGTCLVFVCGWVGLIRWCYRDLYCYWCHKARPLYDCLDLLSLG